jgi:hypothetical protein
VSEEKESPDTVESPLTKEINRSGFPLQLAIAAEVRTNKDNHGWRVLGEEIAWRNQGVHGSQGFIDILLTKGDHDVLVLECKRVLDSHWLFLTDIAAPENQDSVFWVNESGTNFSAWFFGQSKPKAYESKYCHLRGQDQSARPMIERTASELVLATEALARQEWLGWKKSNRGFRHYVSAIITTADLKVGKIDSSTISLSDGKADAIEWHDVPFLKFRKQLTTHDEFDFDPQSLWNEEYGSELERCVYVVNARSISKFLTEYRLNSNQLYDFFNQRARSQRA